MVFNRLLYFAKCSRLNKYYGAKIPYKSLFCNHVKDMAITFSFDVFLWVKIHSFMPKQKFTSSCHKLRDISQEYLACEIFRKIQYAINLCSCLWEAAIQESFQNKVVIRTSHQDAFFNIAVGAIIMKFLEKLLWWSAIFNKLACNTLQL